VAGLDVASFHFAASPPHYQIVGESEERFDAEESATLLVCTEEDVAKSITAAFGSVPTLWQMLCRFALAPLLFHREWMRKRLHKDSRLSNAVIFRRHTIFDRAVSSTMICYPWNNDCKSLWRISFTGTTPVISNSSYDKQTLELLAEIPKRTIEGVEHLLNARDIGGGNLTIDLLRREFLGPIQAQLDLLTGRSAGNHVARLPEVSIEERKTFDRGDGPFCRTPKDYRLNLKLGCLELWCCWHFGESTDTKDTKALVGKVVTPTIAARNAPPPPVLFLSPPWKTLKESDLLRNSSVRSNLYNMRFLCKKLDAAANISPGTIPALEDMAALFATEPVQALLSSVRTKTSRVRQNAWTQSE